MSAPTSPDSGGLSFRWDKERGFSLLLVGFGVLSLLAHLATFFLFQVTYPQRVTIPPPAPQLLLLHPSIPGHDAALRFIAAEDPALSASPVRAEPRDPLVVAYQPSFAVVRAGPLSLPAPSDPVPFPPATASLDFLRLAGTPTNLPQPSPPKVFTQVAIAGPLASMPMLDGFVADIGIRTPMPAVEFLVGVNGEGKVQYLFLQGSSGDKAVDDAISERIARMTFTPTPAPITWGRARVTWGDDAFETSRTTAVPANSSL